MVSICTIDAILCATCSASTEAHDADRKHPRRDAKRFTAHDQTPILPHAAAIANMRPLGARHVGRRGETFSVGAGNSDPVRLP
jgi:hypothetical protein